MPLSTRKAFPAQPSAPSFVPLLLSFIFDVCRHPACAYSGFPARARQYIAAVSVSFSFSGRLSAQQGNQARSFPATIICASRASMRFYAFRDAIESSDTTSNFQVV